MIPQDAQVTYIKYIRFVCNIYIYVCVLPYILSRDYFYHLVQCKCYVNSSVGLEGVKRCLLNYQRRRWGNGRVRRIMGRWTGPKYVTCMYENVTVKRIILYNSYVLINKAHLRAH